MTYCLGIMTHQGLIMASDSRTNAGYDDVNVCTKMHRFVLSGERVFILLCSGSLSLSQSVLTLLESRFQPRPRTRRGPHDVRRGSRDR